jgi:hypothetical protein
MKRHIAQLGLTLALAAMVAACSNTPRPSAAERLEAFRANAGEPVSSFSMLGRRFSSWSSLGNQALAVWTRPGQAYLLELNSPCLDLNFATAISISNMMGRVSSGFDSVYVRGGLNSPMRLPCRINSIRPVNVAALRQTNGDSEEGAEVIDRPAEEQQGQEQQGQPAQPAQPQQ